MLNAVIGGILTEMKAGGGGKGGRGHNAKKKPVKGQRKKEVKI